MNPITSVNLIVGVTPTSDWDQVGGGGPVVPEYLLLENGDFLLLETGDKLVLE